MKQPKPLLREGATDFERRLLSAALGERPSPGLHAQMRRGIGLTGSLFWASSAKAMLGTLLGKSLIGAASLIAAGGLVFAVRDASSPPSAPSPSAVVRAVAPSARRAESEAVPAVPALAPAASSVEAAADQPAAGKAADDADVDDAAAGEDSASNGQLREEIRLLDQARGALQRGSAQDARSALDEYRARFPAGIMGREANVLLEQTRSRRPSHAGAKEHAAPRRAP